MVENGFLSLVTGAERTIITGKAALLEFVMKDNAPLHLELVSAKRGNTAYFMTNYCLSDNLRFSLQYLFDFQTLFNFKKLKCYLSQLKNHLNFNSIVRSFCASVYFKPSKIFSRFNFKIIFIYKYKIKLSSLEDDIPTVNRWEAYFISWSYNLGYTAEIERAL